MGLPPAVVATALGPSGSRTQQCRRPGNATGASHRKPENGNEARTARRRSATSAVSVMQKARPARARTTGPAAGAAPMLPKRQSGARARRDQAWQAGWQAGRGVGRHGWQPAGSRLAHARTCRVVARAIPTVGAACEDVGQVRHFLFALEQLHSLDCSSSVHLGFQLRQAVGAAPTWMKS